MADAVVDAARAFGLTLSSPLSVREEAGAGVAGRVDGRLVAIGTTNFVSKFLVGNQSPKPDFPDRPVTVDVGVDGELAGVLLLRDKIRSDAPKVLGDLTRSGIRRVVLASGDRDEIVRAVSGKLGIEEAHGGLTPEGKVELVTRLARNGPVMMVGDGVNDAPALAVADVGVAMGARGAAASSEAADVVLLVDKLGKLAEAMDVAHHARKIAMQSVVVGLGLSIAAMLFAAFGYLPPVYGALLQEAIDVVVIVNALRVLKA
jgi:P-type E1-E2 ATPase